MLSRTGNGHHGRRPNSAGPHALTVRRSFLIVFLKSKSCHGAGSLASRRAEPPLRLRRNRRQEPICRSRTKPAAAIEPKMRSTYGATGGCLDLGEMSSARSRGSRKAVCLLREGVGAGRSFERRSREGGAAAYRKEDSRFVPRWGGSPPGRRIRVLDRVRVEYPRSSLRSSRECVCRRGPVSASERPGSALVGPRIRRAWRCGLLGRGLVTRSPRCPEQLALLVLGSAADRSHPRRG